MTPQSPNHLIVALQTRITDEEIDQYLRMMVRTLIQNDYTEAWMYRRTIFDQIHVQVSYTLGRWETEGRIYCANRGETFEDETRIEEAEDRWHERMTRLQMNSIVRQEDYNIINGVVLLKWSGQYTYNSVESIRECFHTEENHDVEREEHIRTCVLRIIYKESRDPLWKNTRTSDISRSNVVIRDYEDRYEEEIMKDHSYRNKYPEVICRLIWKRDLFREELHTIPYRPVHLELLYSLDLPVWFKNDARRAEEHFKSLA